jgi:hypothetical protein
MIIVNPIPLRSPVVKYLILAITAVMISCIVPVHAAAPKASGYLPDYDRLVEGEYLEAYWVDAPRVERSSAPQILLGTISVDGIRDHKGVTVANCVDWLESDLKSGRVISDSQEAKYRLDLAITHMDPGSAAKRLLAGEFGAGHAQLQIEGKVIDVEKGEVVAMFAERRRSSGAIGIEDLAGDAGPHIIEHLVRLISTDVNSELLASFLSRQ